MASPLDSNESNRNRVKHNTRTMDNHTKRHDTVDKVVNELIAELPLEPRVSIADLEEGEFRTFELALGKYLRYKLDQQDIGVNEALRDDCIARSGEPTLDDADAATVILKKLWKR